MAFAFALASGVGFLSAGAIEVILFGDSEREGKWMRRVVARAIGSASQMTQTRTDINSSIFFSSAVPIIMRTIEIQVVVKLKRLGTW